jgi:hypothetical protein
VLKAQKEQETRSNSVISKQNVLQPATENPEEHGYAAGSDAFGETFGFNPKDSQSIASD